jgi:glycosyltransferase involved in cell wall biosynthesis
MRLAIDMVGARHSGVSVVGLGVVDAALANPAIDDVVLFASPHGERRFKLPLSSKLRVVEPELPRTVLGRFAWNLGASTRAARAVKSDAFLCLANGGLGNGKVPVTVFIQQSLPFSREALATLPRAVRMRFGAIRQVMRQSVERASLVGVQTETMRAAVIEAFHADPHTVRVFPPPVPVLPTPESEERFRDAAVRTVLYVGNTEPYKNVERLLAVFPDVHKATGARLLLVSPDAATRVVPGVFNIGPLSRTALHAAYRASDLLVFPSFVETVGLPLLEAMSCGVAVLAADRPYAREMCGNAAVYFEPAKADTLRDALIAMLDDSTLRHEKGQAGRDRLAARAPASYDALVAAALAVKGSS